MKLLWLLVIALFAVTLSGLNGCSHFKSGKGGAVDGETAGLGEQENFGEDGFSKANRLKAPYNQSYHFDFDRYEVKSDDVESINVQGNYLLSHPSAKVRLEGNTDERGSREYNIALGWKRAKAVAEVLKQQGINSSQIIMVSFGKEKPIALGHDEDSYSKNRRVDLIYESK